MLRHLHETDVPVPPVAGAALEQAYDVLRSLGAVLEDAAIRPARDYYDVKITIAESEIYAVHERKLRAAASDFGEDFLGRTLAAVLIRASDYVQAQRERRIMLAEMERIYGEVRRAAGRRPRSSSTARCLAHDRILAEAQSHDAVQRYRRPGFDAVHRLHPRGAAAVHADRRQAIRRSDRAARRGCLRACNILARPAAARSTGRPPCRSLPPVPEPAKADITAVPARRDRRHCARVPGSSSMSGSSSSFARPRPYIDAMVGRLHKDRPFDEEPMNVFQFSGNA